MIACEWDDGEIRWRYSARSWADEMGNYRLETMLPVVALEELKRREQTDGRL
jgi:hypothetical protein